VEPKASRRPKPPSLRTLTIGAVAIGVLICFLSGVYFGYTQADTPAPNISFPTGWKGTLILAALFAVASLLTVAYWRGLDEAAKEAHKWAWWWGGSFAILPPLIALPLLAPTIDKVVLPAILQPSGPFAWLTVGILTLLVLQMTGYLIAWAFWWFWRR
jgi:hypothetical protein